MVQSVLSSLTLGYRPLWNRNRRLAGIQLYLHEEAGAEADVQHLLRILQEIWGTQSPPVLLSPQSRQVLCNLLERAPKGSPWIEVRGDWLQDSGIYELVRQAHARGLMLVWRGPLADVPDAQAAHWFASSLLYLPPEGAAGVLNQSVLALQQAAESAAEAAPSKLPQPLRISPKPALAQLQLLGGQMYEGLHSLALADLCLDRYQAGAIAGWPVADALYAQRHHPALPGRDTVLALMRAVDAEQSLEVFEDILGEDPILAYRFLLYTNSAALGLRGNVDSLRRGLVMLGYGTLQRWLTDQLPHACTEPSLEPVRGAMRLRAGLAERLIEAGVSHELQREVYLLGLFSQLDLLLGEPLATALRRIPLSERVFDAAVTRTGPYAAALQLAIALESEDPAPVRQLREDHELDTEDVNRILLRMLSELQVEKAPAA
ncbi:MAG: HDOD domain-containing protein [Burkholderiaceae bacterium]|jgi:hypothetical protein|nr:HDOD domain-containing protein [Burkholderiaceae bacterium]